MNKTKKRTSLFVALVCVLVLVLSLGIMTACNGNNNVENVGNATGGAWYYGASLPSDGLGQVGDYYLNTKTLASYKKTASGWSTVSMEESGQWFYGKGEPDEQAGAVNDFYLDTQNGNLYHKGSSGWGEPVLKLFGRDGVIWFSGKVAPDKSEDLSLKDAIEGDFYLDYSTFDVYQLGADGKWNNLGNLKGESGEDAKDPVQFYNGNGAPTDSRNAELLKDAKEGDLYLGVFDGADGKGAGSRLYRYLENEWVVLMDNVKEGQVDIHSYSQLIAFAESVASGTDYQGMEVHLKTDIDFNKVESVSLRNIAATDWSPIGTSDKPFRGTFDGEGHIISGFSTKTTEAAQAVGFFGYVEGATIEHLHFIGAKVEASGESSVGAVVVGQAKGDITVKDVTIETSKVTSDESATTGSLVGSSEGNVTLEKVDVEVTGSDSHESGSEDKALVGSGSVTFQGENTVEYPISDGFVEKHYKNNDDTSVICEISSLDGLEAFRDSVNGTLETGEAPNNYSGKNVALTADIDLSSIENWEPIGTSGSKFAGTFDGQGHTISDLKITTYETKNHIGLFGCVDSGTTFKNFTVNNATIEAPFCSYVAGIVGTSMPLTMTNVHLTGEIEIYGKVWVGGLLGNGYATITNCSVEQTSGRGIYIYTSGGYAVGGIAGKMSGSINDCTVKAHIAITSGWSWIGALIGGHLGDPATVTYNNNTFDVTLVSEATSYEKYVGALIGNVGGPGDHISSSFSGNTGTIVVTATVDPNGHGFVDNEENVTLGEGNTLNVTWNGFGKGEDGNWHITGDNPEEALNAFRGMVNGGYSFQNETVVLDCDVDLAYQPWTPIGWHEGGNFLGTFDGNGNTIKNLKPIVNGRNAALFGRIARSECTLDEVGVAVKNLNLSGVEFTNMKVDASDGFASGFSNLGALVGEMAYAKIENVHVTDYICMEYYLDDENSLKGGAMQVKYAGALVGTCKYSVLENCSAIGRQTPVYDKLSWNVSASNIIDFGGIVGYADTENTIENCRAEFAVNIGGSIQVVGGIAAWLSKPCKLNVKGCYVNMNISFAPLKTGFAGGVLGYGSDSTEWGNVVVENCYVTGDLAKANNMEYGGSSRGDAQNVGGILGFGSGVEIKNCFIDADVANDQMTVAVSNDGGDWNVRVTGCSWKKNIDSHNFYGLKSDDTHPNHLYGTVTKDTSCSFTAGMTYEAFKEKLAEL